MRIPGRAAHRDCTATGLAGRGGARVRCACVAQQEHHGCTDQADRAGLVRPALTSDECPIDLQIAEPVARTKRSPMKIPPSESALLIRTDFSDESAWQKLLSEVRDPAD